MDASEARAAAKKKADSIRCSAYRKRLNEAVASFSSPTAAAPKEKKPKQNVIETQRNDEPNEEDDVPIIPVSDDDDEEGFVYDDQSENEGPVPVYEFDKSRDENIYAGSDITIQDFTIGFLVVANKAHLSIEAKNLILEFIKSVFPPLNNIPPTFNQLIKTIGIPKPTEKKICTFCHCEIWKSECENRECESRKAVNKDTTKFESLFVFDVERQIRDVLRREWGHFRTYIRNLF